MSEKDYGKQQSNVWPLSSLTRPFLFFLFFFVFFFFCVYCSALESETFDLGGQTAATIERTISDAFGNGNSGAYEFPQIARGSMIRLTFVTGAGKLGRAKYDDGAAKAVTSTLRSLGCK